MRLFARAIACGLLLLATFVPVGAVALLLASSGTEALIALGPAGWASLAAGLVLPSCAGLLVLGWMTQRAELATLRQVVLRQGEAADGRHHALQALVDETREQTALLQEQSRLLLGQLSVGKRQAETAQALMVETRLQRLVAEWEMTGKELSAVMAAMWRLVFGWRTPEGPEGKPSVELPLPAGAELGLAILRLLPATPEEMAQFEVDERFVRQAAHYRAVFRHFIERVPETGPLNRALFRDMVQGRLDARLALLPRPNHAAIIPPETLAAE
ncbi:hypothetical protein [Paracraurococcus ruber]|uniref:Uncharacterized protein n=1 Tax=Paracraurococcus ruber TaxID=77675 RepID=A0ABS1CWJ3_9PROT|nr:hypothetical protein [Paracraurococcus ruber]MBK1658886.1 hypothetical protein [Paracraurococcus ruber]TDG32252.1 hypothetical protein E2C05_07870 [Paracraurococcus ruber]